MAIPPVTLNLLQLLHGDDQQTFTDKINYNLDQIISLGGGPPGLTGSIGIQGVPGSQGIIGFTGNAGDPGSYWYVQSTTPATSPSPNVNDYWFNIATLEVSQWNGTTWVNIGTLTVSGVFKEALGDTDRLIFSSPTPLKSLVLSHIDYGVGSPLAGSYKLKLVGSSGSNIMNFAVDDGGAENPAGKQSYITVSTISTGNTYSVGLINPAGPIEINAPGTSFKLVPQAGLISDYEFNGTSLKIQINANERNLGFAAAAGSGLGFHIGLQDALTVPASRGLSVIDLVTGFKISLRGAHSDSFASDAANFPSGIFFDSKHNQISTTAVGSTQLWSRFRSSVSILNSIFMNVTGKRTFDDPGSSEPGRSAQVELSVGIDAGTWHSLLFSGGAKDATQGTRATLRFRTPTGNISSAIDYNGYWAFGSTAFITDNNSTTDAGNIFYSKLNIEGPVTPTVAMGNNLFSGIHFVPANSTATSDRIMGITAGLFHPLDGSSARQRTNAGMFFTRTNAGSYMNIEFATGTNTGGTGTLGARTRMSLIGDGTIYMHGINNVSTSTIRDNKLIFDVDKSPFNKGLTYISSFDSLADGHTGMAQDIILQSITSNQINSDDANYRGGGFLGIGDFSWSIGRKPQTKFHVNGSTTFGTRTTITDYDSDVMANVSNVNWTFGESHTANGHNALILGSYNTQVLNPASNVVVIGSANGGTLINSSTQSNMVIIPSWTYMTTESVQTVAFSSIPPEKGGTFAVGYTGTNITDFLINTHTTKATTRILYLKTRNDATHASNGLDIIGLTSAAGINGSTINNDGGTSLTNPVKQGYFLHCIGREYIFTQQAEKTVFIVDGYGKTGIGDVPIYKPNNPIYDSRFPTTWTGFSGPNPSYWNDKFNSFLQIGMRNDVNMLTGRASTVGGGISLANGIETSGAFDRITRNDTSQYSSIAHIITDNVTKSNTDVLHSRPMLIAPGTTYGDPLIDGNQRIFGSSLIIKGGEAGSNTTGGVVNGGDVIIHGGRAWESNDKDNVVDSTLNNNPSTDAGYGNISLAYDWEHATTAGAVSIGVGTPVSGMYIGKLRLTKTGSSTGTVQVLSGKDFMGRSITATENSNVYTVTATVTWPTPFPTGQNYSVICQLDTTSANHYTWKTYCINATNTGCDITTTNAPSNWSSGSVDISFIAFCTI